MKSGGLLIQAGGECMGRKRSKRSGRGAQALALVRLLDQLGTTRPRRRKKPHPAEAIAPFGLRNPPFEAKLRDLLERLALAPEKPEGRHAYRPDSGEPLATVLLKALCALYDPRLRRLPQTRDLRRLLRHQLPRHLQWGPDLRIPGRGKVPRWEQARVRPACQALLKLYRADPFDPLAVADVLARFFPLRSLSRAQAERIVEVIHNNESPHHKARDTAARCLGVSRASVDNFHKARFTRS